MNDPARYWEPLDIDCPTCDAPQGIMCRQHSAQIKSNNHIARNKVPVIYVCETCERACSVGLLGGKSLVHIGKVDATHNAKSTQRRRPSHEEQKQ